jgi:hypothetical protein
VGIVGGEGDHLLPYKELGVEWVGERHQRRKEAAGGQAAPEVKEVVAGR